MQPKNRRLAGAACVAVGVALALASIGPVFTWPLGVVVAVVLIVLGCVHLTDRRPYDHARDGI